VIVSVPHTGTRTLGLILGETSFWHFCQNENDFEALRRHIDFPIRDPLATSISWRANQSNREDMDEFRRWDKAIEYLSDYEPGYTIHVMENYAVLDGASGMDWWFKQAVLNHDLDALKELPEVRYLLEWYPTVEWFFKPHYPEGFWWHRKEQQSN